MWWSAGIALAAALLVLALVTISRAPVRAVSSHSVQSPHIGNLSPAQDSVVPFGDAPLGVNALANPNAPVVGMAATPDGKGYWLVASDGGIFTFGDAGFYGSTGRHLNAPVVGMAATPDGKGYWLVASDGGIFTFGDAGFYGSTGRAHLQRPGRRHGRHPRWQGLLARRLRRRHLHLRRRRVLRLDRRHGAEQTHRRHGGHPRRQGLLARRLRRRHLHLRRRHRFYGSEGAAPLQAPVVGMAATPDGKGYWLVASDGGIFTFGHAAFSGSEGGAELQAPAVGMAATPDGGGYWLVFGAQQPLVGKVVGIDPGHNGLNYTAPQIINQPIWNGQENEACDTTGTATDGGYSEAQYNFNVATFLQADLEAEGAQVVMTRSSNAGIGPCVTTRAAIINDAHADVAVDIHADGGPVGGRGFAVLEPVADGPNDGVIASSDAFATIMRNTFGSVTGMPVSTYDGVDGLQPRDDLAGLNLTTVPKVLIETGNMRNAADAALLVTPALARWPRCRRAPWRGASRAGSAGRGTSPRRPAARRRRRCRGRRIAGAEGHHRGRRVAAHGQAVDRLDAGPQVSAASCACA
jgi:N-acetylmuramoyl-L-alanine amidase